MQQGLSPLYIRYTMWLHVSEFRTSKLHYISGVVDLGPNTSVSALTFLFATWKFVQLVPKHETGEIVRKQCKLIDTSNLHRNPPFSPEKNPLKKSSIFVKLSKDRGGVPPQPKRKLPGFDRRAPN